MSSQTYIEGTEPLTIPEIDELYEEMRDCRKRAAAATEEEKEKREALLDLLRLNQERISEAYGDRGYVVSYHDEERALGRVPKGERLLDRKIRVKGQEDDE